VTVWASVSPPKRYHYNQVEYRGWWPRRPVLGGGSPAIDQSHRMFNCARCHELVTICTRCDCGQRYCSTHCAQVQRRRSVREAGRRYQRTRMGARNNAARQKRWRTRFVTTVTHHASPTHKHLREEPPGKNARKEVCDATSNRALVISQRMPATIPAGESSPRCAFCGRPCGSYTRWDTLSAHRRRGWRPDLLL